MILVTGATGTTGRELVRLLAEAGARVRALVRDPDRANAIFNRADVDVVQGDLGMPESLDPALYAVEKVYLLSSPDPRQVELQGNMVEAARHAGVRHLVKHSAYGASLDAPFSLGRWHAETERQIERSGVPFTHLQPEFFMQNMLGFASTIAEQGTFYAPMRRGRTSTVDARDVAAVAARVLLEDGRHEGRTYVVTGPESLSFTQMAETLSRVLGKRVNYVDVPPDAARQSMMDAGMPDWLAQDIVALYAMFAAGRGSPVTDVVPRIAGRSARSWAQFAEEHASAFAGKAGSLA